MDVAFVPQINEFRDERTVQMNVLDIRPACQAVCSPEMGGYRQLQVGTIPPETARELLPDRATLAVVWRYLAAVPGGSLEESPMCLCRKIVRWSGSPLSLGRLLICLDIFADVGLLESRRLNKYISIRLSAGSGKADLNRSRTMQRLLQMKES